MANIVQNRWFDRRDGWKNVKTVGEITANKGQFSGYGDANYNACMKYLNNRDGTNKKYENIINTVMPYYELKGKDILNGAILYYSPKSMIPPGSLPKWDFDKLKEEFVSGIDSNSFRFFKYK